MKLKHCEIVTDYDKLNVNIEETCAKYKSIKQWAYILHDKDDTRPHYHIYLNFGNSSVDTSMVAGWFDLAENFVNRVKGHKVDMLKYLTHSNESQKGRHQYSPSEIVSNFNVQAEIELNDSIGDFEHFSYAQQLDIIHNTDLQYREKAFKKLENLWKLECKYQAKKTDRNIKVYFITGESGTGKTSFAKQWLNGLGLDYCISSSNNDVFQDYQGQKAIILDDLRDSSFALTDLLKILDNNTNSSISSRYNNKVFNGEIMIITSCKPLCQWYNSSESTVSSESLQQLYRRISMYVKVTEQTIFVSDEIDSHGKPNITHIKEMPNTITAKYKSKPKPKDNNFDKIYNILKQDPQYTALFEEREKMQDLGLHSVYEDIDDGELPF